MAKTAAEKMVDYRKRKREQGLRQVTFWVPDLRNPQVRERLRREARLLRDHASTKDGDQFIEAALVDLGAQLRELEGDKD